ncbi:MAG TPA: hypothetical protein K8U93_03170 [Mammaliicoccus lentus]|nr:hypothetical protein [Mammaliicoccus lentus]HJF21126.1 hypothetical protein [Mammaliicoccus lentus]
MNKRKSIKQKKTWVQRFSDISDNIGLAYVSFLLISILLIKIVVICDNTWHIIGDNQFLAVITLIGIVIISLVCAIFIGIKVTPWINKKLSDKFDFPLSQLPDVVISIFFVITSFVAVLVVVNSLKVSFGMSWLPDSGNIATLLSICVAVVTYLGNTRSKFIISAEDKVGLLLDDNELRGDTFYFWCTNTGGRAGNIQYLGWCKPEDRKNIGFDWELTHAKIKQFHTLQIVNQNALGKFMHVKPGEMFEIGKVVISPEDKLPPVFYLVFINSVGKVIFRKMNYEETQDLESHNDKTNDNQLGDTPVCDENYCISEDQRLLRNNYKKKTMKNMHLIGRFTITICLTLILISGYNLLKEVKLFEGLTDVKLLWSFWTDSGYYSGLFLLITAIFIGSAVICGTYNYRKDKPYLMLIVNWLVAEGMAILIKPVFDDLRSTSHSLTASSIIFFIFLSWLSASLIIRLYFRNRK